MKNIAYTCCGIFVVCILTIVGSLFSYYSGLPMHVADMICFVAFLGVGISVNVIIWIGFKLANDKHQFQVNPDLVKLLDEVEHS